MHDLWPAIHTERAALIADLESLDDTSWDVPSGARGWSVHDVVAHLVDTARTTRLGFLVGLARARFDFDRQNARGIERFRGRTPAETLARLREAAPRTTAPPGGIESRLVEEVVHGEDVRRPLGIVRHYPVETVVAALRYQAGTGASMGGAKDRVEGLRLVATDAELTIGDGPEVRGTALALLLALTGRPTTPDPLTGDGAPTLTARFDDLA